MEEQMMEPAVEPQPKKLSSEDLLRVENCYLKVKNLEMQQSLLQQQIVQIANDRKKHLEELNNLQTELCAKHGMEVGKAQIRADGTIVEVAQTNGLMQTNGG